jgi:hypothetical protein
VECQLRTIALDTRHQALRIVASIAGGAEAAICARHDDCLDALRSVDVEVGVRRSRDKEQDGKKGAELESVIDGDELGVEKSRVEKG